MANYPSAASSDSNLYIAKNNLSTSLASSLDLTSTTVTVVSTTGFPSVGFVSVDLEIISYTSVDATHFLGCTRAAEGSTVASHANGAGASHNVVAAHHNVLKDETIAVETDLVNSLGTITPVTPKPNRITLTHR